jgi:hypothetical protein
MKTIQLCEENQSKIIMQLNGEKIISEIIMKIAKASMNQRQWLKNGCGVNIGESMAAYRRNGGSVKRHGGENGMAIWPAIGVSMKANKANKSSA